MVASGNRRSATRVRGHPIGTDGNSGPRHLPTRDSHDGLGDEAPQTQNRCPKLRRMCGRFTGAIAELWVATAPEGASWP